MKAGVAEKAVIDPRYAQLVAQNVIKDVFDALVELITNSDDSYHRLYLRKVISKDGGQITVEIGKRTADCTPFVVKDRAEGMTLQEMRKKIKEVGKKTSGDETRGFMGRGAKECAVLGKAIFESIKEDKYYKCEFTPNLEFIPYEPPENADKQTKERLGIIRGNGTVVTLEIKHNKRVPQVDTIIRDLPHHYALRDICAEDGISKVILRSQNRTEPLMYPKPVGELKCDEEFEVPNYPGVKARVVIWYSETPLESTSERFRRNGFIIKGKRAIHECSLLHKEFERDPLATHYFGRIQCEYIDQLCDEFDQCRSQGQNPPDNNFCLIIDPDRQKGLRRDHPFTEHLLMVPCEKLRVLVAADREKAKEKHSQIANEQTVDKLNRLAKAASKFLKEQLEESQESSQDDFVDNDEFVKRGMLIYPTYFKIALGQERVLSIYAKSSLINNKNQIVKITSDSPALLVVDNKVELKAHKTKAGTFMGYFRVQGRAEKDAVLIEASIDSNNTTKAIAQIVEKVAEEHTFVDPLEFEHKNYQIKEGKRRSIKLFAKYPDVISQPTSIEISSTDSEGVPVRNYCELVPLSGTNFACGEVVVQARRLNARAEISAKINGYSAYTTVKVIQKPELKGPPIRIEITNVPFGNFRARWADHENQPNLLLVSAQHKSLSRYLGPGPQYAGQNNLHFKILLAEIVTESVCRKLLVLEAQERSWEFRWADEKEDHLIATSVIAALQSRMKDFSVIAHSIMIDDKELSTNPML